MRFSFVICLYLVCFFEITLSLFEFSNIKCESFDKEFTVVDYCYLKSINRTYKYASWKMKMLQLPINNATLNFAILKRLNGYKPFLYNVTFDACKMLRSTKRNLVVTYIHGLFADFTNMNHSCPYDHDLIIDKVSSSSLNVKLTKLLPFPTGDYAFSSKWFMYNKLRFGVTIFGTITY